MNVSVLDLVLLLATVMFAVSGYRQGFVVGLLSFVGFFGGGFLGVQVAPALATRVTSGAAQPVVGLLVVFVLASLGQLLALALAHAIRARLRAPSARTADSLAGAAVSVVAVLLVGWLVATPLASSRYPWLAAQVKRSAIIKGVDAVMPDAARRVYASFRGLLDRGGFPDVFDPLVPTQVIPVQPPDPRVVDSPGVAAARRSVVKIVGTAPSCSRRLEGTGFVYAAQHVMTNAHVVAGVTHATMDLGGGDTYPARVVLYDPNRDVAVLWAPTLLRPALHFGGAAPPGASAVVAGYPLDGPFAAVPARVRSVQNVRGPNIYDDATVTRQVYTLRALVRSGNSGGPLLAETGRVLGVVFAAAADNPDTGYALTASAVAGDAATGAGATDQVDTASCS